jgi:hypothetical protein
MSEQEKKQAEELDAFLEQLQSGKQPAQPDAIEPEDAALLEKVVAFAHQNQPQPHFAAKLERTLQSAAQASRAVDQAAARRESGLQGIMRRITQRSPLMYKRILIPLASVVALALTLWVVLSLGRMQPGEQNPVAGLETSVPTSGPQPSQAPSGETPSTPPRLVALPFLSSLMQGGFGGSGSSAFGPVPIQFILDVDIPSSPGQAAVYLRDAPTPLSVEAIKAIAAKLGLQPIVYAPQPIGPSTPLDEMGYLQAIDGRREVLLERSGIVHYTDWILSPWYGDYRSPASSLPSQEQAVQSASQFLEAASLLDVPYLVGQPSSDMVPFRAVVDDGAALLSTFATVSIGSSGQPWSVTYENPAMQNAGDYPIISAQEAWDLLDAGELSGRVWLQRSSDPLAWDAYPSGVTTFWLRHYASGQRADIFGKLQISYPVESGASLYITINGVLLQGDRGTLEAVAQAYLDQMQDSGDVDAPIHVWGTIQEMSGYQILSIEGWEAGFSMDSMLGWVNAAGTPYTLHGTIQRQGPSAALLTDGGEALPMPDVPSDLPTGSAVFVQAGEIGGTLEWSRIQIDVSQEFNPPAQPSEILAHVEEIQLRYFVPSPDTIPAESAMEFTYRWAQPVWYFSGHTEQGARFEVYVQALSDQFLSSQVP